MKAAPTRDDSARRIPGRRRWLATAGTATGAVVGALVAAPWLSRPARAHVGAGPVNPPLPAPALDIRWHDGGGSTLAARLTGRVTALQTMFTACSATCPLQGALFSMVESQLGTRARSRDDGAAAAADPRLQLISLSIDPLTDDPAALTEWLARYGAGPLWSAGAPRPEQVDGLFDFLRARSRGIDRHTGQVYLFNPRAELVLRTVDLPPPEQIVMLLEGLAALG